jgi:hypothetical protein
MEKAIPAVGCELSEYRCRLGFSYPLATLKPAIARQRDTKFVQSTAGLFKHRPASLLHLAYLLAGKSTAHTAISCRLSSGTAGSLRSRCTQIKETEQEDATHDISLT